MKSKQINLRLSGDDYKLLQELNELHEKLGIKVTWNNKEVSFSELIRRLIMHQNKELKRVNRVTLFCNHCIMNSCISSCPMSAAKRNFTE